MSHNTQRWSILPTHIKQAEGRYFISLLFPPSSPPPKRGKSTSITNKYFLLTSYLVYHIEKYEGVSVCKMTPKVSYLTFWGHFISIHAIKGMDDI